MVTPATIPAGEYANVQEVWAAVGGPVETKRR